MEFNATFIVSAISFIVFTIIMNAIFYKPIQKIVTERQKFIDDNYEEAKQHKANSEKILKDKERKLEKTKSDAKKIITQKADDVKTQKVQKTQEAQKQANVTIESAKDVLQQSKQEAQKVLSNNVIDLASSISSKILGEQIEIKSIDNELINKIIQEG